MVLPSRFNGVFHPDVTGALASSPMTLRPDEPKIVPGCGDSVASLVDIRFLFSRSTMISIPHADQLLADRTWRQDAGFSYERRNKGWWLSGVSMF